MEVSTDDASPRSTEQAEGAFKRETNAGMPIINSVSFFARAPPVASMKAKIGQELLQYLRFASVPRKGYLSWYFDPVEVDIAKHVHEEECKDDDEMMQRLDELAVAPLTDLERPWWEVHILRNRERENEIVMTRVHHVVGDGIALTYVSSSIFEDAHGQPYHQAMKERRSKSKGKSLGLFEAVKRIGRYAFDFLHALTIPLIGKDSELPAFVGKRPVVYSGKRKTLFITPLRMETVKDVQTAANATFNDVVYSVTAGALRRHAEMYSPDVVSEERQQLVRAMLPFGFPRDFRSPAGSLRNVWCFVSVPSAFNVSSGAAARLRETSKLMNRLKEGMQPLALFLLQNYLLAWFPISVTRRVNTDSFQRHSMIFTNVPGPQDEVYVCGKKVRQMHVIFPNLIPQVDVLSYGGLAHINFVVDPDVVPDIDRLGECWKREFEELAAEFNVDSAHAWVNPDPHAKPSH